LFNGASTGTWSAAGGRYAGTPLAPADTAINLMNLGGVMQLATTSLLDLNTVLKTSGRAGFVFDRYSDTDFKFAAIDVATTQVMIGHRASSGWFIDAAVTNATLNATTDYTLGVTLRGSTASITLNGQAVVGFAFNGIAVDGRFGLFSRGASASFDSVTVKTNDPAVPAAQTAAISARDAGVATSVSQSQLQPLAAEAARRWSLVEDALLTARLGSLQFVVADLPGDSLAEYLDGRITIDVDAGGHGWFVDPTPSDDREFSGNGAVLHATPTGRADGGIDLLSVLAHEMGHAIGFGHSEGGVMDDDRLPGERALPDAWFGLTVPVVASGRTLPFAAPAARFVDRAQAAATAPLDWTVPAPAASVSRSPAASTALERATDHWQQRFVNHLGATPERLNPNAGLKVHLPIAPRLTKL
jgi:hypothetical protein